MKKYFLFTLLIITLSTFNAQAKVVKKQLPERITTNLCPTDSVLIAALSSINLVSYQGKPVDSLLAHIPSGYIAMQIGGWRSQRLAETLYITYPGKIYFEIHVRDFQFMNPHLVNTSNPTQNWDISLFRKEKITYSIIFNGPACINGCENQFR